MDISRLNMRARGNEGAWIEIAGPDGSPTGIKVHIRGARSDDVRASVERHQQRVAEAYRAKRDDFAHLETQREAELAEATVIDWSGIEEGGQAVPATPENVRRIMTDPGFDWFAVQVYSRAQDAAVFLKP